MGLNRHLKGKTVQWCKPRSISRRIASERDGLGSGCRSIQAAIFASSSTGIRTPLVGDSPVRGRPRGLFSRSAIDLPLFIVHEKQDQPNQGAGLASALTSERLPVKGGEGWLTGSISCRTPDRQRSGACETQFDRDQSEGAARRCLCFSPSSSSRT